MTTSERTPEGLLAQEAVRHLRARVEAADPTVLDLLFREARTHYGWSDRSVPETTLRAVYDLARWGPTSMNQQPARYLFVRSAAAKERLLPAMMRSNREKVASAPVTAIIAYDQAFYEKLPRVYPPSPRSRDYFAREPTQAAEGVIMQEWQPRPVPAQRLFQEKRGYGRGCPWTCGHARPGVTYHAEDYPVAAHICRRRLVLGQTFSSLAPPNDIALMDSYGEAFHKVLVEHRDDLYALAKAERAGG